jgi:hypothetical protein
MTLVALFFGCLFLSNIAPAQTPQFQYTIQSWMTYTTYGHYDYNADSSALELKETTTQFGWGLRRVRLRGKWAFGEHFVGFVQFETVSPKLLDAQIDVILSDKITLRMGRFIGPGSEAGGRTSHTSIDFAERSIVGRNWAEAVRREDYRTFGLSLIGKAGFLNYEIMASNGDGSVNLRPYNTTSNQSITDTGFMPQLDFMVHSHISECLHAGLHYGLPNEKRVNVSSLTAFFYMQPKEYNKGNIRAKIDFAQVRDKTAGITEMGYGAMGFIKFCEKMEFGIGYANWDPDTDMDKDGCGNITVGINYSPHPEKWNSMLFKLAGTFKLAQAENEPYDPFMFHLMWQIYAH